MSEPSDQEYLDRFVRDRDMQALESFVARHGDIARRAALVTVADPELAEEALQEAVWTMLRRPLCAREVRRPRSWFVQVVVNAARRLRNRRQRHQVRECELFAHEEPVAPTAGETEERLVEFAGSLLTRLPATYRVPIELRYFEGLTCAAIGRRLGETELAIRQRMARGLRRLREVARSGLETAGVS